jgi:hypothetical protein
MTEGCSEPPRPPVRWAALDGGRRRAARRGLVAVIGLAFGLGLLVQPVSAAATSATALRLSLGHLFAIHGFLSLEAMRAAALDAPERAAVLDSLSQNTDSLQAVVTSIYGDAAGSRFRPLWQGQIDALLAYADASVKKDEAAKTKAKNDLAAFRTDFAAFLQSVNPRLSSEPVAEALQLQLVQLTAYADGDFERATTTGRLTYARMFEVGDQLARAIATQFPARYPGRPAAFGPKAELTVALRKFLGEHLVLAADAMRAAVDGAPDAASAKDSLAANTADLAAWVASVYGRAAGAAFDDLWTKQTTALLDYIDGLTAKSDSQKVEARQALDADRVAIAKLLSSANPALDQQAVAALIDGHISDLIAQADAYSSGDFPRSVMLVRRGYERMFTVADALAGATAKRFPARFAEVSGAPSTATTGIDDQTITPLTPERIALLVVAGAAAFALVVIGRGHRPPRTR